VLRQQTADNIGRVSAGRGFASAARSCSVIEFLWWRDTGTSAPASVEVYQWSTIQSGPSKLTGDASDWMLYLCTERTPQDEHRPPTRMQLSRQLQVRDQQHFPLRGTDLFFS
jgi:hypothetical protein